eukprot:2278092-Karenia_brevis.AAC.1
MESFRTMADEAKSMSAMVTFGNKIQHLFNDSPNLQPGSAASAGDAQPGGVLQAWTQLGQFFKIMLGLTSSAHVVMAMQGLHDLKKL